MTSPDVVASIAAHGLPGGRSIDIDDPLPEVEWRAMLDRARQDRLLGLVVAAVEAEALPVREEQADRLADEHEAIVSSALGLEEECLFVVETLRQAGVSSKLLKGLATCHLDYPDPAQRTFGDVDLLVPSASLGTGRRVLTRHGYEADLPERRRGFDDRFAKDVTLIGPAGYEIDLHRNLALGPFGQALPLAKVWSREERFVVGGQEVTAFDATGRLLHAAYTAILGDPQPRLVALRDVAQLLTVRPVDEGAVVASARRWGGAAVLAGAVRLAGQNLAGPSTEWPLLGWARTYRPSGREELWLSAYGSAGGSNGLTLLAGVLGVAGWTERARYLQGFLRPDAAYTEARQAAGRPPELRTGMAELRARIRRR